MHLHKWDIFYDLEYSEFEYKVKRMYRYCHKCRDWQLNKCGYMEDWWEGSYTPEGVEDLIPMKVAFLRIKDIEMKQNARRVD